MSDADDAMKLKNEFDSEREPMIAVSLSGKNPETWDRRKSRFTDRIANSFKKLLGSEIPSSATANNELLDTADDLAKSAQAVIKMPQLNNLERQASIALKLAEVKEKEANTRKINLDADRLEFELEVERVHESQKAIDLLIQRGELMIVEQEGEITFIYKKREIK